MESNQQFRRIATRRQQEMGQPSGNIPSLNELASPADAIIADDAPDAAPADMGDVVATLDPERTEPGDESVDIEGFAAQQEKRINKISAALIEALEDRGLKVSAEAAGTLSQVARQVIQDPANADA